jgi:PilZ domain
MQTDLGFKKVSATSLDRRRHPRYRFSAPVTIRSAAGVAIPGITIEISGSGLSSITAHSLKVNDTVELEPIAGGKVLAVVRRNIGRVYGLEFLNLTAEQTDRIKESCKVLPLYQGTSLGF